MRFACPIGYSPPAAVTLAALAHDKPECDTWYFAVALCDICASSQALDRISSRSICGNLAAAQTMSGEASEAGEGITWPQMI
jgi:hypothetical protein